MARTGSRACRQVALVHAFDRAGGGRREKINAALLLHEMTAEDREARSLWSFADAKRAGGSVGQVSADNEQDG